MGDGRVDLEVPGLESLHPAAQVEELEHSVASMQPRGEVPNRALGRFQDAIDLVFGMRGGQEPMLEVVRMDEDAPVQHAVREEGESSLVGAERFPVGADARQIREVGEIST